MGGKVFFDTSVLIYAITGDDARSAQAERLLAAGGNVSVQVLNEFAAVARRKLSMSWKEISEALDAVRVLCEPPRPLTIGIHDAAVRIAEGYGYYIYDSLILAAALDAKCTLVYWRICKMAKQLIRLPSATPFCRCRHETRLICLGAVPSLSLAPVWWALDGRSFLPRQAWRFASTMRSQVPSTGLSL